MIKEVGIIMFSPLFNREEKVFLICAIFLVVGLYLCFLPGLLILGSIVIFRLNKFMSILLILGSIIFAFSKYNYPV